MFKNIGGKIKAVATLCAVLGIVGSIVCGLIVLILGILTFNPLLIIGAIAVVAVGSLQSWLSVLFLYGFGELIEKATEIAENTRRISDRQDLYDDVEVYDTSFNDCT